MPEPQSIKKPGSLAVEMGLETPEPIITTMPERYIGAPAGKPPVIREIVETKVATAPPPPPPKPPTPPASNKKKKYLIFLVIGVILFGLAVALYIVVFAPAKTEPTPPPVNVNQNTNTNVNIPPPPPPPPEPVCGNGVVETGEECDIASQNGVTDSGCSVSCKIAAKTPPPPPNTGIDSDSDGLTDVEEKTIYNTNYLNIDSDGDTFNDGNEVSHLYDPGLKAPSSLMDSVAMRRIQNDVNGYIVIVPANWTLSGEDTAVFLASAPTGEIFEVLMAEKPQSQSLVEWFLAMSPGTDPNTVERVKTLQGYDALRSPDRLTTYVDAGDGRIYTLAYIFTDQPKLEFRTTYEAFVGGFELIKK